MHRTLFWAVFPFLLVALMAACGSDNGAKCKDECPMCPEVPPPPPKAKEPIDAAPLVADREVTLELIGFSDDATFFAMRAADEAIGNAFVVYEAAANQIVKRYPYMPFNEDDVWRKAKRKYKLSELDANTHKRPGSDLVLMGADTDKYVVIYVMKGERAVPYFRIPRLANQDGVPAGVSVKQIAWAPDGAYAVVIHGQSMKKPRPFAADYVHVFELKRSRLPFAM